MSEDNNPPVDEQTLDHICWYVVNLRNTYAPPSKFSDGMGESEKYSQEHWDGYARGSFNSYQMVVEFLEDYHIDVVGRAKRYVDETDGDLEEPKSLEELKEEFE